MSQITTRATSIDAKIQSSIETLKIQLTRQIGEQIKQRTRQIETNIVQEVSKSQLDFQDEMTKNQCEFQENLIRQVREVHSTISAELQSSHQDTIQKQLETQSLLTEMKNQMSEILRKDKSQSNIQLPNSNMSNQNFSNPFNLPPSNQNFFNSTHPSHSNTTNPFQPSRESIPKLKIDTYDGTTPWNVFIKQFEFVTSFNSYTMNQKTAILISTLRGKARLLLETIDNDQLYDYEKLKEILQFNFEKKHTPNASFIELQARKQKPNEDILNFANDIKQLVRIVYSTADIAMKDRIGCLSFISGIWNFKIREQLNLEKIDKFSIAIDRAIEMSLIFKSIPSFKQSEKPNTNHTNTNTNNNKRKFESTQQNTQNPLTCWHCGKSGHFKKSCKLLSTNPTQTYSTTNATNSGN